MADRQEKSHPLVVKAKDGQLESCGRAGGCEKWGQGVLHIESKAREKGVVGRLFLSMAGCELCVGPQVTQKDLDIIREFTQTSDEPFETATQALTEPALEQLAQTVNALPMPTDTWLET